VERPLPTLLHGQIQPLLILLLLGRLLPKVKLTLLTAPRLQIEADLYRVADVAVYQGRARKAVTGPRRLYNYRIVSPDDRYNDLTERLED
jgi:hypothetical protein